MSRFGSSRMAVISLCLFAATAAVAAAGQQQASAPSSESPQAQAGSGPLVIEPISSGFAVTPEVIFTTVNHSSATLVGASGGWLYDDALLLGAGGYWLVNGHRGTSMSYFGVVAEWTVPVGRSLRVGVRGLFGEGTGELIETVAVPYPSHPDRLHPPGPAVDQGFTMVTQQVHVHQDFLVFEPQATAVLRFGNKIALDLGGGYRLIGDAGSWDREWQGGVGRVGVKFGPF
jgi:hypothetical protein